MEFRRIENCAPQSQQSEDRGPSRGGADVIDLGFGNPDIPMLPDIAVEKLAEAARNPRNDPYPLSRGLPKLREAIAGYYKATWDVDLDPELFEDHEHDRFQRRLQSPHGGCCSTAAEPSCRAPATRFTSTDRCLPEPICVRCPCGLTDPEKRDNFAEDFFDSLHTAYDVGWPKPRVLVISFPHNPTGACVDLAFMQRVVDFCRERDMIVVHDFAYADVGFDGVKPPSILQARGAKDVAVEQYSMTKSFSMAGWRCAFMLGNAEVVQALVKLKSYLDYGMFQPVQIAATVTLNEQPEFPKEICATYERRCDALIDGLERIGWHVPKPGGSMFVWAPIPEAYADMDSVEFCLVLDGGQGVRRGPLARSRFRPRWRGYARFALIENEKRIQQAIRNLRRGLTKLG